MRRSLLAVSLGLTIISLVVFAPLSEAMVPLQHCSTAAQLPTAGSVFDQLDNLFNNFTKRFNINPLAPQSNATPSVKITGVKTANGGQSAASSQVIVSLQNGQVALDGVRVTVSYKTAAGVNVLTDSTVVSLKSNEARSITFVPKGLSAGDYAIGAVAYKDGTNPSNQATPPYDTQQNAATLTISSASPSEAGAAKANSPGSQTGSIGDILGQISPWMYFIIAMTGLISIALFFVFSQNRSGDDRYQDDHFREEGHSVGENIQHPPSLGTVSQQTADAAKGGVKGTTATNRRSTRIKVTAPEPTFDESRGGAKNPTDANGDAAPFDTDGFVVGDVTSKKALRDKMRGKRGA